MGTIFEDAALRRSKKRLAREREIYKGGEKAAELKRERGKIYTAKIDEILAERKARNE